MFSVKMQVRDYECDLQGVVNNAVYQNYLEHSRHQFLLDAGIDFVDLSRQGIDLMVIRAELDYKASLKPGDEFSIEVAVEKVSKIKYAFVQTVYRQSDGKVMLQARTIGVAVNDRGRPFAFADLERLSVRPDTTP
ncbi:acyl-CoA thioesterase [Thiomicrorhabdus sp.]|uniref:acyl-CoA thioesterase n=1 Tax=Thiomicrorhabdus sp. TaxID=2039724 RepID=UPI0029C623A0|nr:acyl-CoA thioesterase [Thiomicrorhabdus sp.]